MMSELEPTEPPLNGAPLFDGAESAWRGILRLIRDSGLCTPGVQDPLSIGSNFGTGTRPTREILGLQFSIGNSRRRLIRSSHRQFNLVHSVAQLVWVLSGAASVDMVAFYNRRGMDLSDDGISVSAAPGARIFTTPDGDQFESVIERLSRDSFSRRAWMQIFNPSDAILNRRDVSCFVGMHFIIRDHKLFVNAIMRSQSAAMVMPHDLFLMLMLHEAVAARLGIELGPVALHWSSSLHYYDDEAQLVRDVLTEPSSNATEMAPMSPVTPAVRRSIVAAEADFRTRMQRNSLVPIALEEYSLGSYWEGLLAVLLVGARRKLGVTPTVDDLDQVPPLYRSFL